MVGCTHADVFLCTGTGRLSSPRIHLFDSGNYDTHSPIDIIVAEDEHGKNATMFTVRRRVEITHDVKEGKSIIIPKMEDE